MNDLKVQDFHGKKDEAHKKAQDTRKKNQEIRKAQAAKKAAEEKQDKALVLDALRAVLKDPEATAAQRIYAVAVLDNMKYYHFAPYGVRYTRDVDIAPFKAALQEQEETRDK